MLKNFPEAIACLKDGTFEEYRAIMNWGHSGEETATTVAYSDPSSNHHPAATQPGNKGKCKVPAYSTQDDHIPLFYNPDDSSDDNSDTSGDAFFLSSHAAKSIEKTSTPTRHSMRLANKNAGSIPSHIALFDPLSSASDTLLKTVVTCARTAQTVTTASGSASATSESSTTTANSTHNSAQAFTSQKRLRTPSPTPQSSKCLPITEDTHCSVHFCHTYFSYSCSRIIVHLLVTGTRTVQEPLLLNDEDWITASMTKSHGLPTPNKIKQDPWSALKDIDN